MNSPPPPNPPGPWLQKINVLLHENDGGHAILSHVFFMCYWCTIFGVLAPVIVFIYLPLQCAVQIIRYTLITTASFFPTKNKSHSIDTNFTYDLRHEPNDSSVEIGIVITGCDTGFGKELALFCANELGYTVFAGCLHPQISWPTPSNTGTSSSGLPFTQHGAIVPVAMDVTDAQQVSNVVRHVQRWISHDDDDKNEDDVVKNDTKKNPSSTTAANIKPPRVFHALVNNAGVGRGSLIDWNNDDLSDYHYCMDVNFFGMIRCCKAFLPLFKEQSIQASHTGARIINITSMAGYISNGLMGMSAYVASKHAANAFSHCLRTELPPSYNIQVCTINPSFHKTPLVDTMDQVLAKKWETLDPKLKEEYGEEYYQRIRELCVDLPQRFKWDMQVVVQQVVQCLRRKYIPPEVIIGTDAKYGLMLLRMIPSSIIDFVTRHALAPIPAIMKKKTKTTTPK